MGRRHISAKRQHVHSGENGSNSHAHSGENGSNSSNSNQDEADSGSSPIKTTFSAISHSRSRSEPAIQHSDLEITASEVDSEDSSEDEGDYLDCFFFQNAP